MTPVVIVAAALSAVAAMFVVHALFRGARREVTVASLKPFEPESRPRLTLAALTERALLACRIALLALAAAIAIHERPGPGVAAPGGDVVAVVPGTTPPARSDTVRTVWLDGSETPVDAPPKRDDAAAGALLALAQSLDAGAGLSVSGALPARDWPIEMPQFGREIDWRGGNRRSAVAGGWSAVGAPTAIVVEGDDPALATAVDEALSLWRRVGLLPETVRVEAGEATGDAAVITLDAPAAAERAWRANVVHAASGEAAGVVLDPIESPGAFATALWHALTAREGARPAPGTVVAPGPAGVGAAAVARGVAKRRVTTPVAPAWLLLAVALFVTERWLALRGASR